MDSDCPEYVACGGGDVESSFFKLRFSGVASSGAESTSRSDSGELGGPVCDGDDDNITKGNEYADEDVCLSRTPGGLLGDDSEPVSWSVSLQTR